MKPQIFIPIATAIGLLAAVSGIPRSQSGSTTGHGKTSGMSTLHDMQSARGADKLAAEDFDDRSLVFPRESAR